jgi:hypothetical protein
MEEIKEAVPIDNDIEKFMYDKMYDELNRCRDWPIKVLAFTSAFFFAVIGFINLKGAKLDIIQKYSTELRLMVLSLWAITVYIIIIQHLRYIEYRNIQIRLQKKLNIYVWEVEGIKIFPKHMSVERKKNIITGWQGWFFYALYITVVALVTIIVIWSII